MNNYCTNCGKKLNKNELVCEKCNTSIIDLPKDYKQPPGKTWKIISIILIAATSILVIYTIYYISNINNPAEYEKNNIIEKQKIKKTANELKSKYLIPYLNKYYGENNYDIDFQASDACIISGDCEKDPVMGCDGGACEEYQREDIYQCMSYYYYVNDELFTLYVRNNEYNVIKGKNIISPLQAFITTDYIYINQFEDKSGIFKYMNDNNIDYFVYGNEKNTPNYNKEIKLVNNIRIQNLHFNIIANENVDKSSNSFELSGKITNVSTSIKNIKVMVFDENYNKLFEYKHTAEFNNYDNYDFEIQSKIDENIDILQIKYFQLEIEYGSGNYYE